MMKYKTIESVTGNEYILLDKELGLKHNPGEYKISLLDGASFVTTHGNDTLRVTYPNYNHNKRNSSQDEIWIFGCSCTYGWTLNDYETYPWLMQNKLSEFRVINFGVNEYSTVQSLMQLQKALKNRPKPKYVVVAYSHLHDHHNIYQNYWKSIYQKLVGRENEPVNIPYCTVDKEGNLHFSKKIAKSSSHNSAISNYLEIKLSKFREWYYKSHLVSKGLMEEFMKICESQRIKLIVGGLDDCRLTKNMLIYCKREGISALLMSANLKSLAIDKQDPSYPNANTNIKYAERLTEFIENNEAKILKKTKKRARVRNNSLGGSRLKNAI
ncbi:MAG: hypothetical protein WD491_04840 [Balneolales bacterium]